MYAKRSEKGSKRKKFDPWSFPFSFFFPFVEDPFRKGAKQLGRGYLLWLGIHVF